MITTEIGGLRCRVLQHDPNTTPEQLVVLNHGFGAPGDDLVGLGQAYLAHHADELRATRFVFPEAPLSAPGTMGGRAWWHIDMAALQEIMMRGEVRNQRGTTPEGADQIRKRLLGVMNECMAQAGLSARQTIVGGFSQGAMSTCDLALSMEEAPAGLIQFSGTLLQEERWTKLAGRRSGMRIVQTHGTHDPILPHSEAEALCGLFRNAGLDVEFVSFPGAHEIPEPAFRAAGKLICDHAQTCRTK